MSQPKILIINLRSQLAQPCATILQERGYRSALFEVDKAGAWLRTNPVKAIILSGGDFSVNEEGAPEPPAEIFTAKDEKGNPAKILGTCYGYHWLAKHFGGKVAATLPEYGKTLLRRVQPTLLLHGLPDLSEVYNSHGDSVVTLPFGHALIARSEATGGIAGFASPDGHVFALQCHADSRDTAQGGDILENFVSLIAGCHKDWDLTSISSAILDEIERETRGKRALGGFSAGVDSSTALKAASLMMGNRLLCVTIDADNLRENEAQEIAQHAQASGLPHEMVNVHEDVALFGDEIDAEAVRHIFAIAIYERRLREWIAKFGADIFIDGTTAPDLIESGKTGSALIKTHHNAIADPGISILRPLRNLFKHEVRALAKEFGLSTAIATRKPFPGPGLPLRLPGVPITHENLATLRWADARVDEIVRTNVDLYTHISQLVVALLGFRSTGQKGDGRAYEYSVGVRPVRTIDYMTATGVHLPDEMEDLIISTVTGHKRIVRVLFDYTPKSPATIEYR